MMPLTVDFKVAGLPRRTRPLEKVAALAHALFGLLRENAGRKGHGQWVVSVVAGGE